jgi:hypothetical protein
MTFANGLARGVAIAIALGSMGVVSAQNGTNYHVLNNNGDAAFIGIGAGGTQTPTDGIGTFVAGEDARGSLQVNFGGTLGIQFSYRNTAFRENVCVFSPGLVSGVVQLEFDGIYFVELDGLQPNNNVVFLRPVCTTPIAASFLAYGLGPSSTVSFVAALSSALGPTQVVLLPDNGLVAGSGTATLVGGGTGTLGPVASGCYVVQFTWTASALPFLDTIDGIWHYAVNSADENQYWIMSDDEMNLTRSNTVMLDGGATAVAQFFSVIDYDTHYATLEAGTLAILANHGIEQNGPYYAQTENMTGGGGPNFGFDAGRGSRAISFSGLGGVKVPAGLGGLGNGAQDPAYGGGAVKTLGFATWDNKPNSSVAGEGSGRITWVSIDLAQIAGLGPQGTPGNPNITKGGGTVRIPVVGTGFIQPTTSLALSIFTHTTKAATSGWPDPDGITSGAFGVPAIAGGSIQFNVGPFVAKVPCNGSLPVNLTYGTTGLNHSPPPALTWDPSVADISGSKEIYLWK